MRLTPCSNISVLAGAGYPTSGAGTLLKSSLDTYALDDVCFVRFEYFRSEQSRMRAEQSLAKKYITRFTALDY